MGSILTKSFEMDTLTVIVNLLLLVKETILCTRGWLLFSLNSCEEIWVVEQTDFQGLNENPFFSLIENLQWWFAR